MVLVDDQRAGGVMGRTDGGCSVISSPDVGAALLRKCSSHIELEKLGSELLKKLGLALAGMIHLKRTFFLLGNFKKKKKMEAGWGG